MSAVLQMTEPMADRHTDLVFGFGNIIPDFRDQDTVPLQRGNGRYDNLRKGRSEADNSRTDDKLRDLCDFGDPDSAVREPGAALYDEHNT